MPLPCCYFKRKRARNMDARIGTKNDKGQVIAWPTRNGLGGPFDYIKGMALTTVPLNDAGTLFYVLPPGAYTSNEHDILVALATGSAPEVVPSESVIAPGPVPDAPVPAPEDVATPKRGGK